MTSQWLDAHCAMLVSTLIAVEKPKFKRMLVRRSTKSCHQTTKRWQIGSDVTSVAKGNFCRSSFCCVQRTRTTFENQFDLLSARDYYWYLNLAESTEIK